MSLSALLLSLTVLAGAGLSDLLGQSTVLLLNRVPPRQFLTSLATGWGLFVLSAWIWALGLWLLGWLLGLQLDLLRVCWLVGLAHAPLLLGVFCVIPHFGAYLFHGLRAAVFFDLVVAVGWWTRAPLSTVVICCLPGWLWHFSVTHLRAPR